MTSYLGFLILSCLVLGIVADSLKGRHEGKNGRVLMKKKIKIPHQHENSDMNHKLSEIVPERPDNAKRFLSLFTVVSFANEACSTTTGINGTCFSRNDCVNQGGTPSGTCASGFGVCCLVTATCGGSTNVNGTYFHSIDYPSTFDSVGSCQLTVNKQADSVCQLRLDFENMLLKGPEITDQKCTDDMLMIHGGFPIPNICGTNTNQHLYVDMGLSSSSPVVLTVVTAGTSFARSFSIKVTQIECNSLSKASTGCLQYFQGVSGRIFSFNYNEATGLQLSDTDYSVCVRTERNFCGIQYSACTDTANTPSRAFSVTGGTPAEGSKVGTQCATDWLTIPCATNTHDPKAQNGTPTVCVDRICGMVFNSATTAANSPNVPVYSYTKPFNIYVHTDSTESSSSPAETNNRGFCLNFIQQPCIASSGK
ncbi:uncharacterized protein LOC111706787 isoform X2 [Eurytemora carolleeae]|uniref:uncharacterized protein LOC111706787 isoform X2 n=1 Tax=Eurytemora carolleeae TaxID=1294199 RepID=UPI000C77F247|nr:uncharacterized protein LOC111706787 isoform X2 [Eurytemora carolleeae]|eukprot:XP_023335594.1 uncharacterized protein LOC111706787 isoform X2 [Eurytemora affinis]